MTWDGTTRASLGTDHRVSSMETGDIYYVSIDDVRLNTTDSKFYVRTAAQIHDSSFPNRVRIDCYYGMFDIALSRAEERRIRIDNDPPESEWAPVHFVERTLFSRALRKLRGQREP